MNDQTLGGSRSVEEQCEREGCRRPKVKVGGHKHCSILCWAVDNEVNEAMGFCRNTEGGDAELWSEVTALNDQLTAYREARSKNRKRRSRRATAREAESK